MNHDQKHRFRAAAAHFGNAQFQTRLGYPELQKNNPESVKMMVSV